MSSIPYVELAKFLNSAELEKREVLKITNDYPQMTVEDAYQIQGELVKLKLEAGHKIFGPKMGLTSRAKMKQMGVEEPIFGYVFDYQVVNNGEQVSLKDLIHPKAEVEIAFIMGTDLEGPGVTKEQVLGATAYVVPAIEIIDSRYKDFKFTLPDVIADNASTSRVVFGNRITMHDGLELDLLGASLYVNGEWREGGAGAAVLGHPAESVAMLANMLARKGEKLKAGDVILTGGITEAILIHAGDVVSAKIDQLGEVWFKLVD